MLYNMNTEFCDGFWVGSFSQCSVVIQHLVLIFKFFLIWLQKCQLEIFSIFPQFKNLAKIFLRTRESFFFFTITNYL